MSSRSRSPPRCPLASSARTSCSRFVRRAWPYRSLRAIGFRRGRDDAGRGVLDAARPRARRSCIATKCIRYSGAAADARMLALTSGGAISGDRRLSRRRRARGHVCRHPERGFRHREQRGRHLPAWQRVVARSLQVVAGSGPRARRAWRAADDPVLARRGAGSQRRALARRVSDLRVAISIGIRPAAFLEAETGLCLRRRGTGGRLSAREAAPRSVSCRRRRRSSSSASSTSRAACSSCCTRRSAAASTRRGRSRCASASAAQFNFELQAAATRGCAAAVARSAALVPAVGCVPLPASGDARATSSSRRCSTRRCSRRAGAGTRPSHSPVPRSRGGKKVPPQLQRMLADDLMARGVPGCGRVPREHPRRSRRCRTTRSSTRPCATVSRRRWTSTASSAVLTRIHARRASAASRATRPEPSAFAHEILEREAVRVPGRCAARGETDAGGADANGERPGGQRRCVVLDADAIERVRDEERPDPRDADELHDAMVTAGFLPLVVRRQPGHAGDGALAR